VLQEHPVLKDVNRMSLVQSFSCVRLVLWDEERRRLVTFREAARSRSLRP
jgi:omega-6 fatty acid desaturase (delta-12 desaturase)